MLRELPQGAAPTGETFLPCQGTLPSPWSGECFTCLLCFGSFFLHFSCPWALGSQPSSDVSQGPDVTIRSLLSVEQKGEKCGAV